MWKLCGRKNHCSLIIVVFLVTSMLVPPTVITPLTVNASTSNHYDGQTLFRGFFFGRGPVADLFPELYSNVGPSTEETSAVEVRLIEQIDRADPSFFQRFEKRMSSGSRVRVTQALEEGSDKLAEALATELGGSAAAIRRGEVPEASDPQIGLTILAAIAWAAVVVGTVAVESTAVAHYTIAITSHVWFWTHGQSLDQGSRFVRDLFVNTVIMRLGT